MEEVFEVKMAKFRHKPSLTNFAKIMKKNSIKNKSVKTTTLQAEVAISKTEAGLDYVQVLPDNPSVGLVTPFRGLGYGQLLNNGVFDFIRKIRKRNKPVLKLKYSSLSYSPDGYDRYILTLPNDMRDELHDILTNEAIQVIKFMRKKKGAKA